MVGLVAPGSEVEAVVRRDGRDKVLAVVVGGLDADTPASVSGPISGGPEDSILGMTLETADGEMMAELGLTGGVLVLEVVPDSPAGEGGIMGGDVITRLGSSAVQSMEDFQQALERLRPGQSVAVRLIRRGSPLFLAIRVPQAEQ